MKIFYTLRFEQFLKKLPLSIVDKIFACVAIFTKDPFDSRLDTHKLHGKLKDKWSFSIDNRLRVLFEFDNNDVIFLDVGNHRIYYS